MSDTKRIGDKRRDRDAEKQTIRKNRISQSFPN